MRKLSKILDKGRVRGLTKNFRMMSLLININFQMTKAPLMKLFYSCLVI